MSTYRAKTTHNVALNDLTVLNPQPRSRGVQVTRRDFMNDGSVVEQGLYVELIWDVLENATAVGTILGVFGLSGTTSANVTVYARDQRYQWRRYNGRAVLPDANWDNYFPRNVVILVRDLKPLA